MEIGKSVLLCSVLYYIIIILRYIFPNEEHYVMVLVFVLSAFEFCKN